MTQEEFDNLQSGDVVKNTKTNCLYSIRTGFAADTTTQVSKDSLKARLDMYEVTMKLKKENQ